MSTRGARRSVPTPEERARKHARYLSDLLWHAGAFLIINVFFWILDLSLGQSGVQWAFWITVFWGFALAFHALAYYVDGRGLEARKYEEYLRDRGGGTGRGEAGTQEGDDDVDTPSDPSSPKAARRTSEQAGR